jgi:hypothetical protein
VLLAELLILAVLEVLRVLLIGEMLRILATEKERLPGANASRRRRHEHSALKLNGGVDLELYILLNDMSR